MLRYHLDRALRSHRLTCIQRPRRTQAPKAKAGQILPLEWDILLDSLGLNEEICWQPAKPEFAELAAESKISLTRLNGIRLWVAW